MRIRLQLVLPLAMATLVALGFLVAGVIVERAVLEVLGPGPASRSAAEHAARVVAVWGVAAVLISLFVGWMMARMVSVPLGRMRERAQRLAQSLPESRPGAAVAEIDEVSRDISRVAVELRDRHGREAREREELAALVESVSEGLIQLDPTGRVRRANRAAVELLGLPADAIGRPIRSLVRHAEMRGLLERATEGAVEPREVVMDGARVLVSAGALPKGGTVAAFVDLTDLRRLEEVRRDFVANASHELKTPLTSIRGYTETLLTGDPGEPERTTFLEAVARNAERLQRIVDDLLDLSRLEAGKWHLEIEPVDVRDAVESAWRPCADQADGAGVELRVEVEHGLAVQADARALEQVLANLYDNALRHTPAGGVIAVSAAGGATVTIEVADTGAGIPRDALPRIFERFYRVDPARSRAEGGTGLGLSIVRHLMSAMGGTVEADSVLGKGATFRLTLPAAPVD